MANTKGRLARRKRRDFDHVKNRVAIQAFASVGERNTPVVNQAGLRAELPAQLHNAVDNHNPVNIKKTESAVRNQGFDTISWQDDNGSRLFIKALAADGAFAPQSDQQLLAILAADAPGNNDDASVAPATITIQTNASVEARLAAQEMVVQLGQSLSDESTTYVLRESVADNNLAGNPPANQANNNPVAISYNVIPKTKTPLLSNTNEFQSRMGGAPKEDTKLLNLIARQRSTRYKAINQALDNFHQTLADIDQKNFGIEKNDQNSAVLLQVPKAALDQAAADLLAALDDYINNSGTTVFSADKRQAKRDKIVAVGKLKKEVLDAIGDGFKAELDRVRVKRWKDLNPLTEANIVPGTGQVIGTGAQGDVMAHTFRLGRQDVRFAVKLDDNQINDDAIDAGIPPENPQQSLRAVTAYSLSEHLGLGIIPRTEFMQATDAEGRPQLGQALVFVRGTAGQREGLSYLDPEQKNAQDQKINGYLIGQLDAVRVKDQNTLSSYEQDLMSKYSYQDDDDQAGWYERKPLPVDINYDSAIVLKGLSDLQLFDVIIGHADRNPGNWIYQRNAADAIIGIKGIDNDDTFGKAWRPQVPGQRGVSKTPDVPPVVDMETALKILDLDTNTLKTQLQSLSDEEQDAAVTRLTDAKSAIIARILGSKPEYRIASNTVPPNPVMLARLKAFASMNDDPVVSRWDSADGAIGNAHTAENSYLGLLKHRKDDEGVASVN